MEYVIVRQNILDGYRGSDWLLRHDRDTSQFWIVYHSEADATPGDEAPQDEWSFEEAQGRVPADVWALAVTARERLLRSRSG